jgi:asparagine synthase (glutamine-hydrolysing)
MCGIAGQFGKVDPSFPPEALRSMLHRGPDSQGVWCEEGVAMVHTRLAIIDTAESGNQPMLALCEGRIFNVLPSQDASSLAVEECPTAQACLVFNGEIYNYKNLREELIQRGEAFQGSSDTEVLLRLLVLDGEAAIPKLQGMFAFAFWNNLKREGLLVRDPLGIKPLYYKAENGLLKFSSEARVLLDGDEAPDVESIRDYFLWGSFQEPATPYKSIKQIPAGGLLRWRDGHSEITRWVSVSFRSTNVVKSDASKFARKKLEDSVARHLQSDVPVGLFLSGGLDSSSLLALTRQILGPQARIQTFSIGFHESQADESSIARRTAEFFNTEHHEWIVSSDDATREIPHFLKAIDLPTIDGFNTWFVCKLARKHGCKVALSGQGGDELFGGYPSFKAVPILQSMHGLLGVLRPFCTLMVALKKIPKWKRLHLFLAGQGNWLQAYHCQRGIFTEPEANALAEFFGGTRPSPVDWHLHNLADAGSEKVASLEASRYLRNQLLRDSDVFSMAHGIELRVPFVDLELLSALNSIPANVRYRSHKNLLLDSVPELPEWLRQNRKKGFAFPFEEWMRLGFGDMLQEACQGSPVKPETWYQTWAVAMLKLRQTWQGI